MDRLTTGIGSLPFNNIEDAFEFSFKHDIPFFPQLSSIHGNMIQQVLNFNFKYLFEFIEIAKDKNIKLIKMQIAGPQTTNLDANHYHKVFQEVKKLTTSMDVLFCLDEPVITKETFKLHVDYNQHKHFKFDAIHSCANLENLDLSSFLENIDYFFYDAFLNPNLHTHYQNLKAKLVPGVVDFKANLQDMDINGFKIISTSCGLENSDEVWEVYTKLRMKK